MRRLFWIFFLACLPFCLWCQQGNLNFRLFNKESKAPIEGAHVFFNNTSFGTISTDEGAINLAVPVVLKEDFILSHISYETKIINDASYRSLEEVDSIFLIPNGIKIDEIVVTQKRSKAWKKNYKRFKKAFLGQDKIASKCEILNPEVLRFNVQENRFEATAIDMIRIKNDHLGYEVDFLLESLTIDAKGSMKYLGHANFKDIAEEKRLKKIVKNRNEIYKKSPLHFFKHLIDNDLEKGKYKIRLVKYINGHFQEVKNPIVEDILYFDSTSQHYLLSFDDFLEIKHMGFKKRQDVSMGGVSQGGLESARFNTRGQGASTKVSHPFSYLYKIAPLLIINKRGNVINHRAVQEYGFWANQRMAHKLPLDFGVDYTAYEEFDLKTKEIQAPNSQEIKEHIKSQTEEITSLSLINDILYGDASIRARAFNHMDNQWTSNFAPPLLDILRINQDPTLHQKISTLLKKHTGVNHFYDGLQWLWANEAIYDSIYDDAKAEIYQHVDPKFKTYFFNRSESASISLDEIVWGGVVQDGIPPLRNPKMIDAKTADYLADDDVVFGLSINGTHQAYPKRILAWHEFFTDEIEGIKIAGVYCTLCGTMIGYDMTYDGTFHDLGTSGFLYRSNKLMYDKESQSLWSTIDGTPVLGPLTGKNIKLTTYATVTTTWGAWKQQHPETVVLSLETGHNRNYNEGEAYKDYFATDQLMFPVPQVDNRLKNKDEVVVIRAPKYTDDPLAISIDYLKKRSIVKDKVGETNFIALSEDDGWTRVYESKDINFKSYKNGLLKDKKGNTWTVSESHLIGPNNKSLKRIPSHNAFWFAWYNAYPTTRLVH